MLYKPLDSGLRRAATGILPSRRIQDILSINDGVLSMKVAAMRLSLNHHSGESRNPRLPEASSGPNHASVNRLD